MLQTCDVNVTIEQRRPAFQTPRNSPCQLAARPDTVRRWLKATPRETAPTPPQISASRPSSGSPPTARTRLPRPPATNNIVTPKCLPEGLYDQLLTNSLAEALAQFGEPAWRTVETLGHDQLAERLVEALGKQLSSALDSIAGNDERDRAHLQVALINSLIVHLRQQGAAMAEHLDPFPEPAQILRALHRTRPATPSPETGLAVPWLFTAGKGSPSLLTELRHEIACCDRVDILVSFITVSGVRKLFDILQSVTATDANGTPRTKLRVLTTTYIGATEVAALDHLAQLAGCEVKVSLDGRRTRLHAKAWIFHRATGFGSAYVGSANLSGAALLGGLEWTVKFTQQGQVNLFARANAHFETLWNDSEFQQYDPNIAGHREELTRALSGCEISPAMVILVLVLFGGMGWKAWDAEPNRAHKRTVSQ